MPPSVPYFITAACWLILAMLAWQAASRPVPGGAAFGGAFRAESVLLPMALVLHGILVYRGIVSPEGLNLGVGNSISLIVWLTVSIYWLGGIAYPGLATLQGFWAPIAALAVAAQWALPSRAVVQYGGDTVFALHFAIAMLAYALFAVASVYAVVMLAEERWLRRGVMPPFLRGLPPLLEMEALLFRILFAAFVLLTLTLVTGTFFSEQLFGRPLTFTHKTVFGILSWVVFGWLLAGRQLRGWRGRLAVRWTLAGFVLLLLAYVGSKFVLEIVLQRG